MREVALLKRALKNAIGPSVGIVIGGIAFRLSYPKLYNETWPNIFVQAALYLAVSYVACFLVNLLIEAVTSEK
jgi:hypothetical protein